MGFMDWLKKLLDPEPPQQSKRKPPAKARQATTSRSTTARKATRKTATPTPAFRPSKPRANDARWIRNNEQVEFRNIAIRGGLLYIGTHLANGNADNEPSLIDPALPITMPRDDSYGDDLPYWPAYARITPQQRGVYLRWLIDERRDPQIPIGYGFLFLYGLERRLLLDRQAAIDTAELSGIRNELLGLAATLGSKNESFRNACEPLIGLIDLLYVDHALTNHAAGTSSDVPLPPPPPLLPNNRVPPVSLRIGLGILARNRAPVPAGWALAWAWYAPGTTIRGAANRCPDEVSALFRIRYHERYGDGVTLDPSKLNRLVLQVRPTNAVLDEQHIQTNHLPDVLALPQTNEIGTLIADVTSALDDYSRWVARYPLRRHSLAAWTWLPNALHVPDSPLAEGIVRQLNALIGEGPITVVPGEAIIRIWMGDKPTIPEKLSRDFGSAAAAALGHLGYGLEPDPRTGVPIATDIPIALFRLPSPSIRSVTDDPEAGAYGQAVTLMLLAAIVAEADGETSPREKSAMQEHLRATFSLAPEDECRLRARLTWQASQPAITTRSLAGMKRRVALLSPEERDRLASGLLRLVDADGTISPAEVTALQKIWKLLGRDPERVASELHAVITGGTLTPGRTRNDAPIVVRNAAPQTPGIPIPSRDAILKTHPHSEDLALDAATIARTMADSATVSALLGDLLTEETTQAPTSSLKPTSPTTTPLDSTAVLIRAIAGQLSWSVDAFASLAEHHGLLPGAALDQVNELAFETADSPLLIEEADGSLSVDPDVLAVVMPEESV